MFNPKDIAAVQVSPSPAWSLSDGQSRPPRPNHNDREKRPRKNNDIPEIRPLEFVFHECTLINTVI